MMMMMRMVVVVVQVVEMTTKTMMSMKHDGALVCCRVPPTDHANTDDGDCPFRRRIDEIFVPSVTRHTLHCSEFQYRHRSRSAERSAAVATASWAAASSRCPVPTHRALSSQSSIDPSFVLPPSSAVSTSAVVHL